MLSTLDVSASALKSQRIRMDTIAANVANMNTTRNSAGKLEPYRRRFALFASGQEGHPNRPGVHVSRIAEDMSPFRVVPDAEHPDADAEGNVHYPNVDLAVEYVNALEASRAYEANVTAMEVTKSMMNATLRLLA
jgi:flagellar basal-body rod protein FlgC